MDWAGRMDVSREGAPGRTAERAAAASGMVLLTLASAQMASLMITGGKVGQLLGRKRAFAIVCAIYGCGSLTTALAPNLAVLMLGWSVLEGAGRR